MVNLGLDLGAESSDRNLTGGVVGAVDVEHVEDAHVDVEQVELGVDEDDVTAFCSCSSSLF